MAGKKKKSLANKLAKMSDEERARYLQQKAEVEEEAKRRKEQLIATFMKKKIKKEEAFSRLNMAKINQNWHQIMRKMKVKEMKDEVENLKNLIERLVEYKNGRIGKLINELQQAEEQYLNNFNSHSIHLNSGIENQNQYIEKLQSQYQDELDELLRQAKQEEDSTIDRANSETSYLKTVIYGQQTQASRDIKESWELYSKRLYEADHHNRAIFRHLCKTRGATETAIWRQMLQVVQLYVERTDVRRSHLQELRRMDAESAEEIRRNEEQIIKEEGLIKTLTANYKDLLKLKTDKIKSLEAEENLLNDKFFKIRKALKKQLASDEKKLRMLTASSNEALNWLGQLRNRGKHLLSLSNTCQKFETEREKVSRWLPVMQLEDGSKSSGSDNDEAEAEEAVSFKGHADADRLTDDEKLLKQATLKDLPSTKPRAKTFPHLTDTQFISIEQVKIETKKQEDQDQDQDQTSWSRPKTFLDKCYASLEKMENFWTVYNKTEIDVMEIRREKVELEKENKRLRGMIRAVLEAVALAKTTPDSRVSTRAQSKRRSAYSAPLRRIVFN